MKRKIAYTTGVLILLLLVGRETNLPAATIINEMNVMSTQDSIITAISVHELYDAFKKDKDAATKKYGNKTITIKGYAVFVGPDAYALPSVELSEKKGGKSKILAILPFSDYLKLWKVSKGNEVIMTGEVRGYYEKGDQVLLKHCEINEVIK